MLKKLRVAIVLGLGLPFEIYDVLSKAGEVLIKITHIRVCCTDAFTLSGEDSERSFPAVLGHKGVDIIVEVGEDVASVLVTSRTWK